MRRAARVDIKICIQCGDGYRSYAKGRKYCSPACYSRSRQVSVPAYCLRCGVEYFPWVSGGRKYCSKNCYSLSRPAPSGYVPRPLPIHITTCQNCGTRFRSSPSQGRIFCSYACFVASGGPVRAGVAASIMTRRYGAKKDANHKQLFTIISAMTEAKDLSDAGNGIPDGIAWVGGAWQFFDIKNPETGYGRRGLNECQKKWAGGWRGGPVYLIHTPDEAELFARGELSSLKRFPDRRTTP